MAKLTLECSCGEEFYLNTKLSNRKRALEIDELMNHLIATRHSCLKAKNIIMKPTTEIRL